MTCAVCHGEIRRVFVGTVETWGHVGRRTPGDRHYARPLTQSAPDRRSSRSPSSAV